MLACVPCIHLVVCNDHVFRSYRASLQPVTRNGPFGYRSCGLTHLCSYLLAAIAVKAVFPRAILDQPVRCSRRQLVMLSRVTLSCISSCLFAVIAVAAVVTQFICFQSCRLTHYDSLLCMRVAWCLGFLKLEVPFSLFTGPSFSSTFGMGCLGGGRFRVTMDTSFPAVRCPAPPTLRHQDPSSSIDDDRNCVTTYKLALLKPLLI